MKGVFAMKSNDKEVLLVHDEHIKDELDIDTNDDKYEVFVYTVVDYGRLAEIVNNIAEYVKNTLKEQIRVKMSVPEIFSEIEDYGCSYDTLNAKVINRTIKYLKRRCWLDKNSLMDVLTNTEYGISLSEPEIKRYYTEHTDDSIFNRISVPFDKKTGTLIVEYQNTNSRENDKSFDMER